jgi:ferredoxin
VACDACGRCALDAPKGTVEMVNGLPVVHFDQEVQPTPNATWRCPTGAIQWLEEKQFAEPELETPARRKRA